MLMIKTLRSKEFTQIWVPVLCVLAVGLVAAMFLTVFVVQRLTAHPPAKQVVATERRADPAPLAAVDTSSAEAPASTPAETVHTVPAPASASVKPRQTAPVPEPTTSSSVTISADGCTITATGTPGTNLVVKASNDRKGGESTYTFPSDGKLTELAGGIAGMTVVAEIYPTYVFGTEQTPQASATGVISPAKCWDW